MLHDPELLLLDEPRANLDPAAAELVEPLIGRESGRTRVVTSHDPDGGLAEADLVLGLRAGRAALHGPADEFDAAAIGALYAMRRDVGAVLRKELRLELRTPQSVPAMALFSVTTFVVFHFALQRGEVDGDLAAGVLWVTLLFAAMLGINRLFVADHEEGGFDGFLLAPVDRTALLVAKAPALLGFLVAVEIVAVPAFVLLLLGPSIAGAAPRWSRSCCSPTSASRWSARSSARSAIQTRARDLLVPLLAPPAADPGASSRRARAPRRCWRTAARRALAVRWLAILGLYDLVFGLARLRGVRLPPRGLTRHDVRQAPARALDPHRRHRRRRVRAGLLLRADGRRPGLHAEDLLPPRADGDRRAGRVRLRRDLAIQHLRTATARWDLRSYVAIHMSLILGVGVLLTGSIWAQGVVGPLVGVGRADAGLAS